MDAHEHRVTQEQAARLVRALAEADQAPAEADLRHQQLMRAALESQLHDLQAELADYEARQALRQAGARG
jgi:hypothetical protein